MAIGDLPVDEINLQSPIADLQSEIMSIIARLSTALADRYAIERELGSNGMATVYLAEDLEHHRKVAAKVLPPELAATPCQERRLPRAPWSFASELAARHLSVN